jgi:multicomponent Na+:H+ antiporter subunit D
LAALAGSALILLLISPTVFGGQVLVHYLGGWGPVHATVLGVGFACDPFGLLFALAASGIGMLLLCYTLSELGGLGPGELGGYACLFQLLIAALIGGALTADLFNLFVWFEVAALASYGLTGFFLERPIALEATFKILVLTTVASFLVFLGAGILYSGHGALNFGQLHYALAGRPSTADRIALALLISGFATKAGLVPFHGWLADAHTAAPGPVSALFSGLMVNFGVLSIARLLYQVYGPDIVSVRVVLVVLGVVSALLGAVLALAQDDLKRLLAYDTVSQIGVLMIGLGSAKAAGVAGATYHLLNHALFKSLLFLSAGAIVHSTGKTNLSDLGGLARRRPLLAAVFLLGIASIAGIPPFNGYVSLSLIHQGLLEDHQYATLGLMVIAQLITIAALGRAAWLAFFRRREHNYPELTALRPGMIGAFGTLAGCCLASGVLPGTLLDRLMAPAASGLLHADSYAASVLRPAPARGAVLRPMDIHFEYAQPSELLLITVSLLGAAGLVWWSLHRPEPRLVGMLRAAHTGSVQDYTAYLLIGLLAISVTLAAG